MRRLALLLLVMSITMFALVRATFAVNSVVIESKAVATGVQVGVFVSNDIKITGAVFPFEIRSVSGGAHLSTAVPGSRIQSP